MFYCVGSRVTAVDTGHNASPLSLLSPAQPTLLHEAYLQQPYSQQRSRVFKIFTTLGGFAAHCATQQQLVYAKGTC